MTSMPGSPEVTAIPDLDPERVEAHFAEPGGADVKIEIKQGELVRINLDRRKDILVCFIDETLTSQQCAGIRASLQGEFGMLRVIVLDGGFKLGVIHPVEDEHGSK